MMQRMSIVRPVPFMNFVIFVQQLPLVGVQLAVSGQIIWLSSCWRRWLFAFVVAVMIMTTSRTEEGGGRGRPQGRPRHDDTKTTTRRRRRGRGWGWMTLLFCRSPLPCGLGESRPSRNPQYYGIIYNRSIVWTETSTFNWLTGSFGVFVASSVSLRPWTHHQRPRATSRSGDQWNRHRALQLLGGAYVILQVPLYHERRWFQIHFVTVMCPWFLDAETQIRCQWPWWHWHNSQPA